MEMVTQHQHIQDSLALERFNFYKSIYPDWEYKTRREKKTIRTRYNKQMKNMEVTCTSSLGCCNTVAIPAPSPFWEYYQQVQAIKKNTQESKMNTSINVTASTDDTKRYLKDRLYSVEHTKQNALRQQFGLEDDEAPKTPKEFLKRIADGKFVVDAKYMDRPLGTYGFLDVVSWRDPAKVRDEAGFAVVFAKLETLKTQTKDAIVVLEPKDGLAALQAFEATTVQ